MPWTVIANSQTDSGKEGELKFLAVLLMSFPFPS